MSTAEVGMKCDEDEHVRRCQVDSSERRQVTANDAVNDARHFDERSCQVDDNDLALSQHRRRRQNSHHYQKQRQQQPEQDEWRLSLGSCHAVTLPDDHNTPFRHVTDRAERVELALGSYALDECQLTGNENVDVAKTTAAILVGQCPDVDAAHADCLTAPKPAVWKAVAVDDVTYSGPEKPEVPREGCDNDDDWEVRYFSLLRQRDWNTLSIDESGSDIITADDRRFCRCFGYDCKRVNIELVSRPRLNFRKMQVSDSFY
jgi:hypothetical protein